MNTMLNNSGSSFDTVPSYDFILRRDDRDDEGITSDVEEENGYHLIASESEHSCAIEVPGVLIVPPTSGSEESRNTALSVPDTVASDLNSILHLPDSVLFVDNDGTSGHDAESTEGDMDEVLNNATLHRTSKTRDDSTDHDPKRHIILALLIFALVSAISIAEALYLRHETFLLKEQVRLLQDQAELAAAALLAIKQEQAKDVVLDNCWLHANAKMTLGDCAYEATETVTTQVHTMRKSIEDVWNQMKHTYADTFKESVDVIRHSVYNAPGNIMESVQNEYNIVKDWISEEIIAVENDLVKFASISTGTQVATNSTEAYSNYKSELQSVSKSIFVTAAWSAAAAILVSAFDFYWKQNGKD
jgi:hypothetical protein